MKSSEILTRAAELVDSGRQYFCHTAMHAIAGEWQTRASILFIDCYQGNVFDEDVNHRVLALLLCAAIAADSGD
jgi:hypothetical protein